MDTRQNVQNFLTRHEFSTDVADGLHERILADMKSGLDGKSSDQAMIQAGSAVMHEIQEGSTAIVIDAGGTNFRSCLVTKNRTGISLSQFEKTFMPGSDRNVSKKEFFSAIASNIARLKDASDRIAFCFSYAMEITDDGDGRILKFSKEVKAQDAVGSLLGKELILELERQRWKKIQKVSVLNDTTALLLADLSATESDMMRSHVAFILGTGMNSAYVHGGRIVVTECGMFNGVQQSDFDRIVDAGTAHAGQSVLEKMCSGVYLGEIVHAMIKTACTEGLFSNAFYSAAKDIERLTAADLDPVLQRKKMFSGTEEDCLVLKEFVCSVVERAAYLSAEAVYAAILAADKKQGCGTVSIACNGSTFWKTPRLKEAMESRLKALLPDDIKIIQIADDITAGSFASAFM